MPVWCIVIFAIGILSLLDAIFNYGQLFRATNSMALLLTALGLLVRIRTLAKRGHKEKLEKNNDKLRERMMEIRNSLDAIKNGEPIDEVMH